MINANDAFSNYKGTDSYYKLMFGLHYTDGVHALCETNKCWWFLDVVVSYQPKLKDEEFQQWKLKRQDNSDEADVICDDGNGNMLRKQHIPFTDFAPNEATLWVENGVILLPSEH